MPMFRRNIPPPTSCWRWRKPWRWRQNIYPKHLHLPMSLQGVKTQNSINLTAMKISNMTQTFLDSFLFNNVISTGKIIGFKSWMRWDYSKRLVGFRRRTQWSNSRYYHSIRIVRLEEKLEYPAEIRTVHLPHKTFPLRKRQDLVSVPNSVWGIFVNSSRLTGLLIPVSQWREEQSERRKEMCRNDRFRPQKMSDFNSVQNQL